MTILQYVFKMAKYCLQIIILKFNKTDPTFLFLIMTILQHVFKMAKYCFQIIILNFDKNDCTSLIFL